jgi:hypothetical protein
MGLLWGEECEPLTRPWVVDFGTVFFDDISRENESFLRRSLYSLVLHASTAKLKIRLNPRPYSFCLQLKNVGAEDSYRWT